MLGTAHAARVEYRPGRYPFVPACSCGWVTTWGYLTDFAAQVVADDHKEFHMGLHACAGCGLELDADDPNDRCEDCARPPVCVCGHTKSDHADDSPPWCLARGGCDCHEYEGAS